MGTLPRRLIAHLDMDAFYASVELLRRPTLKGLPVVIGGARADHGGDGPVERRLGDYVGRGVVTTATYAARAFGVRSGMGLMKAATLAPQAILLPVDFEAYRLYSRRFKAAVAEIAPSIEDRGIDEIYMDLSEVPGVREAVGHDPYGGLRGVAREIKNNVWRATGLSCSIGLAPNKLLAKIASDLDKPDGITLLMIDEVPQRLWPLPVRTLQGVGPKSAQRLEALGIETVGQLAAFDADRLAAEVGAHQAAWLQDCAQGRDDRPVVTHSEPVSMSRETTFGRDLHPRRDRSELGELFTRLCQAVAQDLQAKGYVGRTVGIKMRFDDFRTVTRDQTLETPTDDPVVIRQVAGQCLKRVLLSRRLRLLGVRVASLSRRLETPAAAKVESAANPAGRSRTVARPTDPASASPSAPGSTRARRRAGPSTVDDYTLSLFDSTVEPDDPPALEGPADV